jgi:Holliday junction resolvase RusA-like endonuclease
MYSIELVVPIFKTDANRTRGKNHFAIHSTFEKVKRIIRADTIGRRPEEPLKKFKLSVERRSPKTMDYDNFVGSLKSYIDGLRYAGIIYDDSWKYIQHITFTQKISQEKVLVIKVEEVA